MPRKVNRKPAIIEALSQKGADPIKIADQFKVSRPYVYTLDKQRRGDYADKTEKKDSPATFIRPSGDLFQQTALPSVRRYGGDIAEEYLRELQGQRGIQLYKEMGNHPIIAAVLQAMRMTLRRIQWYAEAPKSGREEEVDFVNSVMNDMEITWADYIDQALSMLQFGFAPFEVVMKIRKGSETRPGPKIPESRFKDGKVGWKNFVLIGQDSLAEGDSWIFDDKTGDLRGLNQRPVPGTQLTYIKRLPVSIPIDKIVLFRTTSYKNNPEGQSILRPMYRSWYYSTNMEEIEAIAYERTGTGFPIFYLGDDISKSPTANSEIEEYRKAGRNIRVDEQMSLTIPHPKMGSGAREGQGVLFEFAHPQVSSITDFSKVIERHEKRMAMVGLAQFIHLGMGQYGAQSLAEITTDFFQLAVAAWADSLCETINRHALIPLLRMNKMDIEDPIQIKHSSVSVPDLKVVADYINKTVGAKVIEPDDMLEGELRRMAGLPEKDEATVRDVMLEVNGDGGTRMDRTQRTKSAGTANNQRSQNPVADKPSAPTKPEARKPMRAGDESEAETFEQENGMDADTFAIVNKALDVAAGNRSPVTVNMDMDMNQVLARLDEIVARPVNVHTPAPIVHVTMPKQETPNVNITMPESPAPNITVVAPPTPPIEVKVEATIPDSVETVTIERDSNQQIKSAKKIRRARKSGE